ncbi:MAG: DUF3822 family protein [Bacteroidia bacterium]|nr:DUF3822 family protein [Bacteroidia bacterium]
MITETDSRIKQVLSLVDDLFDGRQTKAYRLAIQLGSDGMWAGVWDDVYNKILAVERFAFQNAHNANILSSLAGSAIRQPTILTYPYKQTSLGIVNTKSTLVPNALFDAGEKEALLKFNHPLEDGELVSIDSLSNLDAKNIYACPQVIVQQFKELYTMLKIVHYSSPLIEQLLLSNKHNNKIKVVLHVRPETFDVIVIDSGKLLFYNVFNWQTSEDLIYYLLFVFEQLKLNPESTPVELLGDIDKNSSHYTMLLKYIRTIRFGSRPEALEYSAKISSLPRQNYYGLFSQFLFS